MVVLLKDAAKLLHGIHDGRVLVLLPVEQQCLNGDVSASVRIG